MIIKVKVKFKPSAQWIHSWLCDLFILVSLQERYRTDIQTLGMVKDLVRNLFSDNDELQMHCASAISKVPYFFVCVLDPLDNKGCGLKEFYNNINIALTSLFCSAVCRGQANS